MQLHPARKIDETFQQYKDRRTFEQQMVDSYYTVLALSPRPVEPRSRIKQPGLKRRARLRLERFVAE